MLKKRTAIASAQKNKKNIQDRFLCSKSAVSQMDTALSETLNDVPNLYLGLTDLIDTSLLGLNMSEHREPARHDVFLEYLEKEIKESKVKKLFTCLLIVILGALSY